MFVVICLNLSSENISSFVQVYLDSSSKQRCTEEQQFAEACWICGHVYVEKPEGPIIRGSAWQSVFWCEWLGCYSLLCDKDDGCIVVASCTLVAVMKLMQVLVVVAMIFANTVAPSIFTQQPYKHQVIVVIWDSIMTTYGLGVPQTEGLLIVCSVISTDS